jgi:putative membrane protein
MPVRSVLASSLALALLVGGPALAQQPHPTTSTSQQQKQKQHLSQKDKQFVHEAAIGGMAEVQLGKLAQQNAQDDQVKQFGARMVQDHSAANDKLQAIAADKGITLPQQLDHKHKQTYDKLSKMKGAQFDRAFMHAMAEDHDKVVKQFRQQAKSGEDQDIKQFAESTLPTLEQHD